MPITKSSYIIDNTAGVGSRLGTNNTAGVGSRMNVHVSGAGGAGNPGTFAATGGGTGTTGIIGTIGTNGTIGANPSWMWQDSSAKLPTQYEYAIQGQMFMVNYETSEHKIVLMGEDAFKQRVKEDLAMALANKMMEAGVIEFTQMKDQIAFHRTIKARCYLVPDNQVRLLRTLYKDK